MFATVLIGAAELVLDLVPPMRIASADRFADGGTLKFEIADTLGHTLVGCFDGRMVAIESARPGLLYLNAEYPTRPNARALPLGGEEERAVVRLLAGLLDVELGRDWRQHADNPPTRRPPQEKAEQGDIMRGSPSGLTEPDPRMWSLWELAMMVDWRERLLESFDRGYLWFDDCLNSYVGKLYPITLQSIALDDERARFDVLFHDTSGGQVTLSLPWDSVGTDLPPSLLHGPLNAEFPFASTGDRYVLTILKQACQPGDSPLVKVGETAVDPARLSALAATVQARIRRTLETDATP
jgi:hypothetical protein